MGLQLIYVDESRLEASCYYQIKAENNFRREAYLVIRWPTKIISQRRDGAILRVYQKMQLHFLGLLNILIFYYLNTRVTTRPACTHTAIAIPFSDTAI